MTTCSKAWAGITAQQRLDWADWADNHLVPDWTGTPVRMSGFNAYCACNSRMLDMGLSAQGEAPIALGPLTPVAFAAGNGVLQSVVTWTTPGGTNLKMDLWAYKLHSAGCKPTIVKAKHGSFTTAETATKTVTGLTAGTWAFYGKIVSEDDGQASPYSLDLATITAV
jgi:hypothetical protein